LPLFAHYLHLTPRDVDALEWREYDVMVRFIDAMLDQMKKAQEKTTRQGA